MIAKRVRARRSPLRALRDRRGVGAVEFAMVMPFLILLYAGASELTLGITVDRKVTNAAATISDLVTQESQVSAAQLGLMMQLSEALVSPFDVEQMSITVTSVGIDTEHRATVDWSSDPARFPRGTPYVGLPSGIANQADRHLIVTETLYRYRPFVMASVLGEFQMRRMAYNQPRISAFVNCTDCP